MMIKRFIRHFILTSVFLFIFNLQAYAFTFKPYKITEPKKGFYVIEINRINGVRSKYELIPYVSEELEYNSDVYEKTNAVLSVNAGFFDPKNQKTVSYVFIDGKEALNPEDNENLMNNKLLEPYFDMILNRSEFRILETPKGHRVYDIAPHNEPVKEGLRLVHSIQGGPMLYPDLKLEEEFFILSENGQLKSQSASALKKYARTGIGIKNNKVYIFAASKEAPLTLPELGFEACRLGMEKAMAFDGGGSTSFDSKELHITSDYKGEAREVKSFLLLKKRQKKDL